jgi:hypothetical protein
MAIEKVFIGVDDERVELTGEDLAAFEADRSALQAEADAIQAKADAQAAARQSALAKLAALGLTQKEIDAL